jgi:hypothetical protein
MAIGPIPSEPTRKPGKILPFRPKKQRGKSHVEFKPTDTREERIRKGKQIVAIIAGKLKDRRQKSYIEDVDIKSAGYESMVRTIDLPPNDFPLDKRIAANARQDMLRFIRKEVREHSYCQAARGARPKDPHAQGVISPGGDFDAEPHDPMVSRADAKLSRAKPHVDRDKPSSHRMGEWRDGFVRHGWININGKRAPRLKARAEIAHADWQRWRDRFWNDVRTSRFDRDACEYVRGKVLSTEPLDRRIAKREQLSTAEYIARSEEYRYRFNGWIYGWSSTVTYRWSSVVTGRRTKLTEFVDAFDEKGKPQRVPSDYRHFHQQPVLDCARDGRPLDGNAFRGFARWGKGYAIPDVRIGGKRFPIPYKD